MTASRRTFFMRRIGAAQRPPSASSKKLNGDMGRKSILPHNKP